MLNCALWAQSAMEIPRESFGQNSQEDFMKKTEIELGHKGQVRFCKPERKRKKNNFYFDIPKIQLTK